jgi:hypothetical protein
LLRAAAVVAVEKHRLAQVAVAAVAVLVVH